MDNDEPKLHIDSDKPKVRYYNEYQLEDRVRKARAEALMEAESKYKADAERLDWICRHIPGNVARELVGDMSCTGNLDEWQSKIDEAIAHEEGKNG